MKSNLGYILKQILADRGILENQYEYFEAKGAYQVNIVGYEYFAILKEDSASDYGYTFESKPEIDADLELGSLTPNTYSIIFDMWARQVQERLNPATENIDAKVELDTENLKLSENPVGVKTESKSYNEEIDDLTADYKKVFDDPGYSFSIRNEQVDGVIGVREQAELMAEVILNFSAYERGNFIGLFGQWGRGKTFFWQELKKTIPDLIKKREHIKERRINENVKKVHLIEFHAWKYQDTPAVWAYLYETLAEKYFIKGGIKQFFINIWKSLKLGWQRNHWKTILSFLIPAVAAFLLAFGAEEVAESTNSPSDDPVLDFFSASYLKWLASVVAGLSAFGSWIKGNRKQQAKDMIKKYLAKVSYKHLLGVQAEIQREISFLLKAWVSEKSVGKEKLLLFVDDIDRCSEQKIIQIIDALKVMLEDEEISKRLIVIAAIDENILKRAIQHKYHDLIYKDQSIAEEEKVNHIKKVTREYIDKLFILGIKLGTLNSNERSEILESITKDKVSAPAEQNSREVTQNNGQPKQQEDEIDDQDISSVTKSISQPDDHKVVNIGNPQFELLPEELDRLKTLLDYYTDATPRAIRIFYFRYVLAKNLKRIELEGDLEMENLYNNNKLKELLPLLIIKYSSTETPEKLINYRRHIMSQNEDTTEVELYSKKYEINRQLLLKLLKITEMVVPY